MHPSRSIPARLVALAVASVACLVPGVARADVFVVGTVEDAPDALVGDGVCATAAGSCSLRAAVQEANARLGPDEIHVPAGTMTFTVLGADDQAASGDLDVRDAVTIRGAGRDVTVIDGAMTESILTAWGVPLRIERLTLARSGASAISATVGSTLRVDDCILRDNAGTDGAAIWADSPACVDVTRSRFERNVATEDGGAVSMDDTRARFQDCVFLDNVSGSRGGGVDLRGTPTSLLVVQDCTFEGNEATFGGGVLVNSPNGSSPGPVTWIFDSLFLGNHAAAGGGVFTGGDLLAERSRFEANTATNGGGHSIVRGTGRISCCEYVANRADGGTIVGEGGGLDVSGGTLSLEDTLIQGNHAAGSGGGLQAGSLATPTLLRCTIADNFGRVGGGLTAWENLTVLSSTIRDNDSWAQGGGINAIGDFVIRDSTITGNETDTSSGGGVYVSRAHPSYIVNTTISANRAPNGAGLNVASAGTGTIHVRNCTVTGNDRHGILNPAGLGALTLRDTVVAGNVGTTAPDCSGSIRSDGHVLLGNPAGCGLVAHATDLVGVDPLLGPLADNDGLTLTHAPLAGSPLLDGGHPAGCLDHAGAVLARDQRGVARPVDADGDGTPDCDIGAVEWTSADTTGVGLDDVPDCTQGTLPAMPACFEIVDDADGDGVPDAVDCAPADPTASGLPLEVTLQVEKQPGGLRVSWTDAAVNGDTGTLHEVANGLIGDLPVAGALGACLAPTARLEHLDGRDLSGLSTWYLARGVNACGPPSGAGWGRDSLGAERPGCP